MKKAFVRDLESGQNIQDTFLIFEKDFRQARNGSNYISLVLGDATGRINARKWDAFRPEFDGIKDAALVRVKGRVETYKSQLQLIVRSVEAVDVENADLSQFLPQADSPPEEMLAELTEILRSIEDPWIGRLINGILEDEAFMRRFTTSPAAIKLHHACVGGLLEHTLSMARTAVAVLPGYPAVNRDLLLTGVFIHDMGKVDELSCAPQFAYTDEGYLQGHLHMGARMVGERMDAIEGFDPGLKNEIIHLVLSHHGEHEFGAPVLPQTREAILLHYIDNIDAKMKIFDLAALKAREEGSVWTEWQRSLGRRLFAGPPSKV